MQMPSPCHCCGVNHNRTYQACLNLTGLVSVQVKTDYQHAVKEGIVDLGFQNPSKAAQLTAHHIDQVKVVHPIPEQGCINLDNACGQSGRVVAGMQVGCQGLQDNQVRAFMQSSCAFLEWQFVCHNTCARNIPFRPCLYLPKTTLPLN